MSPPPCNGHLFLPVSPGRVFVKFFNKSLIKVIDGTVRTNVFDVEVCSAVSLGVFDVEARTAVSSDVFDDQGRDRRQLEIYQWLPNFGANVFKENTMYLLLETIV